MTLTHTDYANAIRALSMDAVEKAQSGHPGMPLGMADIATVLWRDFLQVNPTNPSWANRDRFVLSNGHGAMLLYALLHLTGFAVSLDDIKQFRQLGSITPGHPEFGHTPGVETTTGPLGQGLANAVGMAIAETRLAAEFNRDDHNIIDHHTYAFIGDGCLMEGISHEVCSLAGTLKLGKLIVIWDDNRISIDGHTDGWFTDDTKARFESYQWHVIPAVDGHNPDAIATAIQAAKTNTEQPTLIACRTQIGYGSPNKANSASAHGSPLGADEISLTRQALAWPHAPFDIPQTHRDGWSLIEKGQAAEAQWHQDWAKYEQSWPELANELARRLENRRSDNWQRTNDKLMQQIAAAQNNEATRKSSQHCLNALAKTTPALFGGSADLTGSNNTQAANFEDYTADNRLGQYIRYGVREFGMAGIMNGIAVHGGFIPYGGTFLTFVDYMRNAVRLSAMMGTQVIYVLTHDSIGLGEDGPTHQPIEHTGQLRSIPNLFVWRPADGLETAVAWQQAILQRNAPSCLLLTRQTVPALAQNPKATANIAKGAYILKDTGQDNPLILIATGSEVSLADTAYEQLAKQGHAVRLISMPCAEQFLAQPQSYQNQILPSEQRCRLAIEAGSPDYWYRFVGHDGAIIGIDGFGASAPAKDVYETLGITVKNIVKTGLQLIKNISKSTHNNEESL